SKTWPSTTASDNHPPPHGRSHNGCARLGRPLQVERKFHMVSSSPIRTRPSRGGEKLGEYSPTLERVAWFTLRRKGIVTLVWLGAAIGLGLLFPQLESVIREQSVDPIPAGVPSFQ